jgi:hypothetical protein
VHSEGTLVRATPCGLSVITSLLVCDSLTTCIHLSFNDLDHLLIVMLTGTVRLD